MSEFLCCVCAIVNELIKLETLFFFFHSIHFILCYSMLKKIGGSKLVFFFLISILVSTGLSRILHHRTEEMLE